MQRDTSTSTRKAVPISKSLLYRERLADEVLDVIARLRGEQ